MTVTLPETIEHLDFEPSASCEAPVMPSGSCGGAATHEADMRCALCGSLGAWLVCTPHASDLRSVVARLDEVDTALLCRRCRADVTFRVVPL